MQTTHIHTHTDESYVSIYVYTMQTYTHTHTYMTVKTVCEWVVYAPPQSRSYNLYKEKTYLKLKVATLKPNIPQNERYYLQRNLNQAWIQFNRQRKQYIKKMTLLYSFSLDQLMLLANNLLLFYICSLTCYTPVTVIL